MDYVHCPITTYFLAKLCVYLRRQFRVLFASTTKFSEQEHVYEPTVLVQSCIHSWPVVHSSMSEIFNITLIGHLEIYFSEP
jgi:hypothetical protein